MAKTQSRKKAARGGAKRARSRLRTSRGRKSAAPRSAAKSARPSAKTAKKKTSRGARAAKAPARKRTATGGGRARKSAARGSQVSRSTSQARWIETPADLSSQPGETLATRSHDVIRTWAEERGAAPATIPGGDPESPRVLRFNFPGFGGENLQPVEWDEWFSTFDDRNLVFKFQERLKNGNQSNFFRFDNPEREDA